MFLWSLVAEGSRVIDGVINLKFSLILNIDSVNFKIYLYLFQKNKQQELKQWDGRLQQEMEKRQREVQHWQDQANRNVSQAQALQAALDAITLKQQQQVNMIKQYTSWDYIWTGRGSLIE